MCISLYRSVFIFVRLSVPICIDTIHSLSFLPRLESPTLSVSQVWECNVVGFSNIGIYAGPVASGFVYIVNCYIGFFDDDFMRNRATGTVYGTAHDTIPNGQSCELGYRTKMHSTAVCTAIHSYLPAWFLIAMFLVLVHTVCVVLLLRYGST